MYDTITILFIGLLSGFAIMLLIDHFAIEDQKKQLVTRKALVIRSK